MVVWQSLDRVWRVEEHNGTWTIRMHTALVAEARSKPEAERWLQELDGPALDEMRQT